VTSFIAAAGIVALAFLVAGLIACRPGRLGPVVAALGALYVVHVIVVGSNAFGVTLVGVGLLLVGELGGWSIDSRDQGSSERSVHASRAIGVVILVLVGLSVAFTAGIALRVPVGGGLGLSAVGILAAVGLLGLVSLVALGSQRR
jgi:hypothetical protein